MALSHHHGGSFPIKLTFFVSNSLTTLQFKQISIFSTKLLISCFLFFLFQPHKPYYVYYQLLQDYHHSLGGKKSQIHLQLLTHRELRDTGEKKKSCKHSLLHIQKVIQTGYLNENSPIISQLKKKFSASLFSFLNRRWRTVEDVIAVVSHNIRFNWQKSREKIKWSETGWTNVHAQPFRCH